MKFFIHKFWESSSLETYRTSPLQLNAIRILNQNFWDAQTDVWKWTRAAIILKFK